MANLHTIQNTPWSIVDNRCWAHSGCIVDLGCLSWDWSKIFIGKKRVIGVDPQEQDISNATLFKGAIAPQTGVAALNTTGIAAQLVPASTGFPTLTWPDFVARYCIQDIAILKINIEGGEYDLIPALTADDFLRIDQIAVSFHHFVNPAWYPKTEQCLQILAQHGYAIRSLLEVCGWYLCVKQIVT